MSEKRVIGSFVAAIIIIIGAGIAETGLRPAGAQSEPPGRWLIVAQQGDHTNAAAWRLNTGMGELGYCTKFPASEGGWKCVPVEVRSK
jgi:hypothetical protein